MRRTQDSEIDVEQALERANNAIQRCNTIIADLLDYASDKDLAMQLGHIDDWLSTVLGDMQIPDTVELKSDFASNAEINFSPDAMQQVVINLVENACQAMTDEPRADGSSAVIEITTRIDGDSVVIMFTDSGPGIAPDARERIFEPLYSTKSFGVGLGLPLVKKIVEQHGGSIEIDPSVGTGAKFTLRFPLVNTEQRVAS